MMTEPLVLHVIHHLRMGGMENGLVNLINHMPPGRFRHAIACVEDYSEFRDRLEGKVEVIAMERSRIGQWGLRKEIYRLCRRLRPVIMHARGLSGLDALLPALLAGVRHRVQGEHGWDVHDLHGKSARSIWLRRLHAPLVERYVTVSKHLERYLIDDIGISPKRITQIYNGVDTDRFRPRLGERPSVLPRTFVDSESIVVGTVGRAQPVKDQATLVRAFAELVRRPGGSGLRLVVVGAGPLLDELRRLAKSLGVDEQTWFTGAADQVSEFLQTFDIFVLPSLAEGISNTILEAMATGLPIVATNVGGNVELVENGVTGSLFAPGDVATLSRLLASYAADASVRAERATAARRVAVDRFGLTTMVDRYQLMYEQLCAG